MFWPTAQRICRADGVETPPDVPYGVMSDWAMMMGAMGRVDQLVVGGAAFQQALVDDLSDASVGYQQFVAMRGGSLGPDFFSQRTKIDGEIGYGRTELWDFARLYRVRDPGVPLLLIPSLINGAHIFAIGLKPSFIAYLCERGYHPYVVHWGRGDDWPGDEASFDLDDYVLQRLVPVMKALEKRHPGQTIHLLGYCMGAILALALARLCPHTCRSLALLSPPWAPIQSDPVRAHMIRQMAHGQLKNHGYLPPSFVQAVFLMMDPESALRKFKKFLHMDKTTPEAQHFVDVEAWVETGYPLSAPAGRRLFDAWLSDTGAPSAGYLGSLPLLPPPPCPTCLLWGTADRVVTPASSLACRLDIPDIHCLSAPVGHLGLLVGRQAPGAIWGPYGDWLDACP